MLNRFTKRPKEQTADASKKRIDELHERGMLIVICYEIFTSDTYIVRELEALKRDLLRQTSITTVAGKIISNGNGSCDNSVYSSDSTVPPTQEELRLSIEERKFEAFLQAYRLTGISVVKCDQGVLLLELATSYNG